MFTKGSLALENVINFLSEYGIVVKKDLPPLDDLYTNEFLR